MLAHDDLQNVTHLRMRRTKIIFGTPDRSRTCDNQIRNLVLYPTELRGHRSPLLPAHTTEVKGLNKFLFTYKTTRL